MASKHPKNEYVLGDCRTFGNLLLVPGPGHIEMNMVRGVIKLMFDVSLKDEAFLMGFKTEASLEYVRKASNNHNNWELVMIHFISSVDELLLPYVRQCLEEVKIPTVHGFHAWMSTVQDPNYMFMAEMSLTYLLALFIYRSGIRRNNSLITNVGRTKFSPLFYILHAPKYAELELRDMVTRLSAPDEVKELLKASESFSHSGHPSKHEGGDFCLESYNRRTKNWKPPGVPSDDQWLRIIRNLKEFDEASPTKHEHQYT